MRSRYRLNGSLAAALVAFAVLFGAAPTVQAAAPLATTGAVAELHFNRASVEGEVNPAGAALEECLFEYGETAAYGKTAPCAEPDAAEVGSGTQPVAVHALLSGLSASTEYHYRLRARGSSTTVDGEDATFTTLAAPQLSISVTPNAEYVLPGDAAAFRVIVTNTGTDETFGALKIKNQLPEGLSAAAFHFYYIDVRRLEEGKAEEGKAVSAEADLSGYLCPSSAECRFPGILSSIDIPSLRPGEKLYMNEVFTAPTSVETTLADFAEVSGGGAPTAEASGTITASAEPSFGHLGFGAFAIDSAGNPYTQAGGHPYEFSTEFNFATVSCLNLEGKYTGPALQSYYAQCPLYDPRSITSDLPPGLIANPQAVPHCKLADYFAEECERLKVAVGTADIRAFGMASSAYKYIEPVLNLEPSNRYPGELGILVAGAPFIVITTSIRDGGDYGVTAVTTAQQAAVNRTRINLWGVPADPSHDPFRGKECAGFGTSIPYANPNGYYGVGSDFLSLPELEEWCAKQNSFGEGGGPAETPEVPFLTMPTECSGDPLVVGGRYDSWQHADLWAEAADQLEAVEGCNALSFEPTIEARPTTSLADAPSGLEFALHVPQNEDPQGVATPELRESAVTLPRGLSLNPASANGRRGCTEAQANLHVEGPSQCPDASKLGEAEIVSSLLHEPLKGSLFLATPHHNPFGSLLAVYLSVEGQGIRIKTPGRLDLDERTGQITTVFPQNPQLPFEDLRLRFFNGALGVMRTPRICGVYDVTSSFTPYSYPESGPPAEAIAGFRTSEAENGGTCPKAEAEEPFAPRFTAGTERPLAGSYSPLSLRLVREDGSQEISHFEILLPPGLTAKLAGIPYCPEAAIALARSREHDGGGAEEQAEPSCPAASEVGTVDVASGAGPTPIHVPGRVYLAGPYKGAPLSLAFITPVVAGPFDLGTTIVRAAVYLDPETVQNHVVSDPLPTVLHGIPLDIRAITVRLNRPQFTLNPTSCEEFGITGNATSVQGAVTPLSERFQLGDCAALRFKPSLELSLSGAVHRNGHPRLRAVLKPNPRGANLAQIEVVLPPTELFENGHLRAVCSKVQFAASECPATSIYGHARVDTPLLSEPLAGPVYLLTGSHRLPDLVAALHAGAFAINLHLHAKEDSVHSSIRSTFERIPDVPFTRFVLRMDGGKKGLLVNSKPLCEKRRRIGVRMWGQNGKVYATEPLLRVPCGHHGKRKNGR